MLIVLKDTIFCLSSNIFLICYIIVAEINLLIPINNKILNLFLIEIPGINVIYFADQRAYKSWLAAVVNLVRCYVLRENRVNRGIKN